MSINDEFKRVLSNPGHVIVSESLENLIQVEEDPKTTSAYLHIGDEELVCQVAKLIITGGDVVFSVESPALSIKSLLSVKQLMQICFDKLTYEQVPDSDIIWEDNLITLRTRRILNEAV